MGETSGQDGGIGRYTVPPYTTKRGTTNLKTKNNQNCQKIKLYGILTTKELKKKHSSRLVGVTEMGRDGQPGWRRLVARWQLEDRLRQWLTEQVVPHLCADIRGGTTGEQDRPRIPGFQCRKRKPQTL